MNLAKVMRANSYFNGAGILLYTLSLVVCFSANTLSAQGMFHFNDSSTVTYKASMVFQYGGESKLTILPKVNLVRIHKSNIVQPYYGIELGFHPLFISAAFTLAGVAGVEINSFHLEASISHFRTTKMNDGDDGYKGPFAQNAINLKLGYSVKRVTLKVGTSFLISESIPQGDERIPLLDIAMINGQIFGIELQFRMN